MPHLDVQLSKKKSNKIVKKIVLSLTTNTTKILGKKPEETSIIINFTSPKLWFVNGINIPHKDVITFFINLKLTKGTITKSNKAEYIKKVFADFEKILGKITPISYIVIQEIDADSWGLQGKTTEYFLFK
jgi:4-oxalocrotonate tautomerase